jgi:hypothetical protein
LILEPSIVFSSFPQKTPISLEVVKGDPKIIILLHFIKVQIKSLTITISEPAKENESNSGGPDWHIIIGGKSSSSVLKSVELFNWKTKEQESQTND